MVLVLCAVCFCGVARGQANARAEWLVGYKRMEDADAAQAVRRGSEALRHYREALETFERVRRKYPTWNAALLNYRINYCKEQIDKLGQTVGEQSKGLDVEALVKLSKEQYVTIGRLSDERKALQSRVEVLSESLERARGEAARIAAIETGNASLTRQNVELQEQLRLLGLKLGEAEREVERLKGQAGLSEELRRVASELKLTAAQLASCQEQLAKSRHENENLGRQLRQQQQVLERVSNERADTEMALKVVRELAVARKRENEALQARYVTLEARVKDLTQVLAQEEKKSTALRERVERAEQSEQQLRSRQAEESERERRAHAQELKSLRVSLEKLASEAGDGSESSRRATLEAMAVQLEATDRELSRLARRMATAFSERERMLAQEEELARLRGQLQAMTAERERQRAVALTNQENYLALKGEAERMRVQLTTLEQRCQALNDEVVKYRGMRERLGMGGEVSGDQAREARLLKAVQDVEQLESRLESQQSLARRQEAELKALRQEKVALEAALAERKVAETTGEQRLSESVQQVKGLQERIAEQLRQVTALEKSLSQARIAEATLKVREEELATARQEVVVLQGRVKVLEQRERELAAEGRELAGLRQEMKTMRERLTVLETRERELLEQQIREHGKDAAAIAQLESQMKERTAETQRRSQELKQLQEKEEQQRQQVARLTQERQALTEQVAAGEARQQALAAEERRLKQSLAVAEAKVAELGTRLQSAEAAGEELRRQRAADADKIGAADGMAKALVKSESEQRRLEAEMRRLRQQSELLQNQLSEAEVKVRTHEKQLEELRTGKGSEASKQLAQLSERLQQSEARVRALEGVLSEGGVMPQAKSAEDVASGEREQAALLQMNAALRRQNELLARQNQERSERLAALQRKLEEMAGTRAPSSPTGSAAAVASAEAARRLAEERVKSLEAEVAVLKAQPRQGEAASRGEPTLQGERERRRLEHEAMVKGYVEQGLDAERQGRVEAARWNYQKALSLMSDNKVALQRLGQLAYGQGDDATAIRFLKQAFYHDPDDVKTLFSLGYAYARQSQADWAVATMGRAISLQPDDAGMARVYGATLMQLGWADAAEREFRRALKLNPKEKDAAFNLAALLAATATRGGQGLTGEHLKRLRDKVRGLEKSGDREAVTSVATMLRWLEHHVRQADARLAEARQWYERARQLGAEPDPALEKVLKLK